MGRRPKMETIDPGLVHSLINTSTTRSTPKHDVQTTEIKFGSLVIKQQTPVQMDPDAITFQRRHIIGSTTDNRPTSTTNHIPNCRNQTIGNTFPFLDPDKFTKTDDMSKETIGHEHGPYNGPVKEVLEKPSTRHHFIAQRPILFTDKYNICDEWPMSSPYACWWCCHEFDTRPIPFPYAYDSKRQRFKIVGNFCSFECAKSWGLTYQPQRTRSYCYLYQFSKLFLKKGIRVSYARPREVLEMFGGPMTIETFRSNLTRLHR